MCLVLQDNCFLLDSGNFIKKREHDCLIVTREYDPLSIIPNAMVLFIVANKASVIWVFKLYGIANAEWMNIFIPYHFHLNYINLNN